MISKAIAACVLFGMIGFAQGTSKFEVASIKPTDSEGSGGTGSARILPGGRLTTNAAILRLLIQNAYDVRDYQIIGGPDWIGSARWNIEARAEGNANAQEMSLMLRSLLEDRFKLKVHREVRELSVYDLTPVRGGTRLAPPRDENCIAPSPTNSPPAPSPPPLPGQRLILRCGIVGAAGGPLSSRINGGTVLMPAFIRVLANLLGRPVVDKTGFGGTFDVDLIFAQDDALAGSIVRPAEPSAGPAAPTIFTAIQEQLGLKLEPAKGPGEVLVIDSVEKASENE